MKKIEKVHALGGTISVPGDKSISHRSVMLGAIAEGDTYVRGFLKSADCMATIGSKKGTARPAGISVMPERMRVFSSYTGTASGD